MRKNQSDLYVSSITIGELRRGIELQSEETKRNDLMRWLSHLTDTLQGRILNFNTTTAHVWVQFFAQSERSAKRLPYVDSMLAATAKRHQLTMATRNMKDFDSSGIKLVNPFE